MSPIQQKQVALVTGGSKGVGRGIVLGLCEAGFTVYFTGRNKSNLEQTLQLCKVHPGEAIPIVCNHASDEETQLVFKKIEGDHVRVQILVNNAWAGYNNMMENGKFTWADKFWEQPVWRWDSIFSVGVRSIFLNSQNACRHMIEINQGLIINISYWAAQKYIGNVIYGASKALSDKLTFDMAHELSDFPISVISLYPGLVRTEAVMQNADYFDLSNSESPQFIGRVVASLSKNTKIKELSGQVIIAANYATNHGIVDVDGKRPQPLTIDRA